jgi:hypothetical protein
MADLRATTVAANYEKFSKSQTDVGKEFVVGVATGATDAQMKQIMAQLTLAAGDGTGTDGGGPDAFTVCAVGTAAGYAHVLKLQGTGTPDLTTVDGIALTELAVFEPAN